MSERNGPLPAPEPAATAPVTTLAGERPPPPRNPASAAESERSGAEADGAQVTGPLAGRPAVRARRGGSVTRMGPWAPAAGALVGLLLGAVAVLLLAGTADTFRERLALVFAVVGLGMLGAAGTLLADEVRLLRRRSSEAAVRPQWVEATAGLVNGLTPARLLLCASAFVLFLSAYVSRG